MGNNLGGKKKAKVMRTNGEIIKFNTPTQAWDITKAYPDHVLLESSSVKQLGLRAKPLSPQEELNPDSIYFLVEIAMLSVGKALRRARSDVTIGPMNPLEHFKLPKRSISDISMRKVDLSLNGPDRPGPSSGPVRMKVRLPKAQLVRLMRKSKDEGEVAKKIIELYKEKYIEVDKDCVLEDENEKMLLHQPIYSW